MPDPEAPAHDDARADDPASLEDHVTQPIGPPPETPAWDGIAEPRRVWRVETDPAADFHWPYFLILPFADKGGERLTYPVGVADLDTPHRPPPCRRRPPRDPDVPASGRR
ncbi:MAG: hypothetical protein ACYSWX_05855 [Planctomycetota bacterium]|jgi:hypothetical protein